MSRYIETIRLENGECKNLPYHQARFEMTRRLELGLNTHPDLKQLITSHKQTPSGLIKCRIIYGAEIEKMECLPYSRRVVNTLKIIKADQIAYGFKYSNREALEKLYAQRGSCDDILIVKNGCVTDSYLANTAFWNGEEWFTPDTPLLPGTMRKALLEKGLLKVARVHPAKLYRYQKIRLINAMNNLEEGSEIPIEGVRF